MGSDIKSGEPEKKRPGKKLKIILIIAAIAAAGVIGFLLSQAMTGPAGDRSVAVPDVVGLYVDEAADILAEAGFSVELERVPLPAVKNDLTEQADEAIQDTDIETGGEPLFSEGQVMEQDPRAGVMAMMGSIVKLKVACSAEDLDEEDDPYDDDEDEDYDEDEDDDQAGFGPPKAVPNLIGKTRVNAKNVIVDSGFRIGYVSFVTSNLPVDTVINQSPGSGETAPGNSRINITVSLGPTVETISTPNFVGMTLAEARAASEGTGIQLVSRDVVISDLAREGRVIAQNPVANASVKKGSTVTIDIGVIKRFKVTVTGGTGSGDYRPGELVTITAQKPEGYEFRGWTVTGGGITVQNTATATFTMPANHVAVVADFQPIQPIPVPNVSGLGLSFEEARAILEEAGFAVDRVDIHNQFLGTNSVIGQSHVSAMPGSTITLTVNIWPAP